MHRAAAPRERVAPNRARAASLPPLRAHRAAEDLAAGHRVARRRLSAASGAISSFTRATAVMTAAHAVRMAGGVATALLLMRRLGAGGFGDYIVAFVTMSLLGTLGSLGVPAGVSWIAARRPRSWRRTAVLSLALAVLLGAATTGLGLALASLLFPEGGRALQLAALLGVIPVQVSGSLAALLQGRSRFSAASLLVAGQSALTVLGVALVVTPGAPAARALGIVVASLWLGAAASVVAAFREGAAGAHPPGAGLEDQAAPSTREQLREILGYGLRSYAGACLILLVYRIDVYLLDVLADRESVGVYAGAVQIAEQLWLVSNAASVVLFSRIAGSSGAGPSAGAGDAHLTARASRTVLLATLLPAVVLALVALGALPRILPAAYEKSPDALVAILPGIVAFGAARVLSSHVAARGGVTHNAVVGAIALALNVLLNLGLIPRLGAVGASLACSLTYVATLLIQAVTVSRTEGLALHELLVPRRHDLALLARRAAR